MLVVDPHRHASAGVVDVFLDTCPAGGHGSSCVEQHHIGGAGYALAVPLNMPGRRRHPTRRSRDTVRFTPWRIWELGVGRRPLKPWTGAYPEAQIEIALTGEVPIHERPAADGEVVVIQAQ